MRTDPRALTLLLRQLRAYVDRITARADAQARAAGLTVEMAPGGVRRYRDPRLDQLAAGRVRQYAGVRTSTVGDEVGAWSTPTLTTTAGWSR